MGWGGVTLLLLRTKYKIIFQVKYFRWCTKDGVEAEKDEETNGRYSLIVGDIFCTVFRLRTCMLEFTDYGAIIPAMRLNNTEINDKEIKVLTATRDS